MRDWRGPSAFLSSSGVARLPLLPLARFKGHSFTLLLGVNRRVKLPLAPGRPLPLLAELHRALPGGPSKATGQVLADITP